jgi:hypothetical protein
MSAGRTSTSMPGERSMWAGQASMQWLSCGRGCEREVAPAGVCSSGCSESTRPPRPTCGDAVHWRAVHDCQDELLCCTCPLAVHVLLGTASGCRMPSGWTHE